ncbi:MAG: hypothetical protein AAB870_04455, partial [Patescibacteria group bacterium]
LGNALHVALPVDPLVPPFPTCTGYDQKTCWNAQTGAFAFGGDKPQTVENALGKTGVHVYTYITTDGGKTYRLCMNLENPGRFNKNKSYCSTD